MIRVGLDVGSTTLKCVVLDENDTILYQSYERHYALIDQKVAGLLRQLRDRFPTENRVRISVSGSAGMGFAGQNGIPFLQEVYATRTAINRFVPGADAVIELGGEDAKILFVSGAPEVRMNGSCAGGTGAFIDQMATLLGVTPDDMNTLAAGYKKIYSIASRCGVFAKSDIQPLLNQGASREDISASIFAAVVNQTIAGLAQGREIGGKVVYLGGPLTFMPELRKAFDRALGLEGICPENSLYFVAAGAAMLSGSAAAFSDGGHDDTGGFFDLAALAAAIEARPASGNFLGVSPLFSSQAEYDEFRERHAKDTVKEGVLQPGERAYIGIDAGSTTVKAVVINEREEIVYSEYMRSEGNPVHLVRGFLTRVYEKFPDAKLSASAATGYGEEIIRHAFHCDFGIVETIAHFTAAKKFEPDVDFIIDIGGQDIKCFRIRRGAIDNIFLNEACSSGCGSFLQTFAGALGYDIADFAAKGIFADRPVDLGSRCTVFMNSSVKQAQKDGASIENISAGLSISVVKNALYKVIRVTKANPLGEHIVVQGGTFLNDAVLRAFEQEIGHNVVRPSLAGVMGAYGAALYAKRRLPAGDRESGRSALLDRAQLASFTHEVRAVSCNGCTNHCRLTVNTFDGGRKFIGGNQCDRPLTAPGQELRKVYSLYDYKRELLAAYGSVEGSRETIGIPLGLNLYELLPFWHTLFHTLGYGIRLSPASSKKLYHLGQASIPSDTACYPAKLMHGHIQSLIDEGVKTVFYPCMSYNFDEGLGDNHYNCPVVAYYPEVIAGNMSSVKKIRFLKEYLGPHNRRDFPEKFREMLTRELGDSFTRKEIRDACDAAYAAYADYMEKIRQKGDEYYALAMRENLPVIVLAGRPYHLDGEINHGIDKFICGCGAVLLSEDSLGHRFVRRPTRVLNQWTYHSRLYAAAEFVAHAPDNVNLVQLVSFGCGVDAITTDEVRRILEGSDKIYTQIKIDEITNLGAVKIRLRSLFAAIEEKAADSRNADGSAAAPPRPSDKFHQADAVRTTETKGGISDGR